METTFLRGVWNIAPTPFHPDGSIDLASVARLVEFTIGCGVDGLTILGVLGEGEKLTEAERDRVIAATLEAAAGRLPVCVGTTHAGTDGCVAFSRRAVELGASAVMVAPPRLQRSSDAVLRRHYLAVADAVDVPVVVQDHPASSGVFMSVEFLARLGEEAPRCRFVKVEDEPSPMKIGQLLAANPALCLVGGLGGVMLLEELRRGAAGTMTGFGFPEILVQICRAWFGGRRDEAATLFYRYCPLMRFENQPRINLAIRKFIYHRRGALASPRTRFPAAELDAGTIADLDALLAHLGLALAPAGVA
jgi:4-hydroxy-tetrahydrodipicolinate synthase